jgi:hypothetical protein
VGDHRPDLLDALAVGGGLGAEVGEVGVGVPRRVRAGGEQSPGLGLPEPAVLDEQPVVEEDALLLDRAAVPRAWNRG